MKVAWVTGSAKRLGKTLALRLSQEGYFTFVHYLRSRPEAEAVLKEIRAAGGDGALLKGDVGEARSVEAMARAIEKKTGRLDLLIHNVGVYRTGPLMDMEAQDLESLFRSNTFGFLHLTQAVASLFPATGGCCLTIGYSGVESLSGTVHNAAYLASKTALLVLVKSLALEWAPRNIRVNMISPGILDNSVELPKKVSAFAPLGRLGRPEDVANAVCFLASDKAAYITGMNLDVAGGYMLELRTLGPKDVVK